MVLSSPSELISCTELSRPTVSGSTACGNSTVSRTGKTGSIRRSTSPEGSELGIFRTFSAILLLSHSNEVECQILKFVKLRFRCLLVQKDANAAVLDQTASTNARDSTP